MKCQRQVVPFWMMQLTKRGCVSAQHCTQHFTLSVCSIFGLHVELWLKYTCFVLHVHVYIYIYILSAQCVICLFRVHVNCFIAMTFDFFGQPQICGLWMHIHTYTLLYHCCLYAARHYPHLTHATEREMPCFAIGHRHIYGLEQCFPTIFQN